ncbi:matrix metalloproteinase-24-like [Tenebrio molitor]|uniref:matrix metalloproteinase-24-like n=1 Tax=Tenebrio molitor TaxID=7067 RepID=UPI0036248091
MNLERINIKINGTQHSTYEYQVNNEDLQRLYAAFLSCNYKKDLDEERANNTIKLRENQIDEIKKCKKEKKKYCDIKFSPTQIGGFLPALIPAALAVAKALGLGAAGYAGTKLAQKAFGDDDINITSSVKPYDESKIQSYLEQFGYLESNGSLLTETSLTSASHTNEALIRFQEFYNLPTDGTLNQETLAFISKPRCGVKDNPTAYRIHYQKWNYTNLKWYFSLATNEMKELAQKAFDQWESVSNLKFEYNSIKPDILISFSNTLFQHNHNSRCQKGICSSSFDGKGIHFDKSENWYFGESSNTPDDQTNFYTVLLHEIGHTLGIEHSANNNSIMYAYYKGDIDKLTQDDMWAIQYLYGRPKRLKYELIPTTTVKPTVSKVWQSVPEVEVKDTVGSTHEPMVNLCDFNKEIDTFLIANHHMYIFFKKYVWLVNLKDIYNLMIFRIH